MRLFHYSNHQFKNLDYGTMIKNTHKIESLIGLYVCFEKTWNKGFGKYCYEIEIKDPKIYELPQLDLFLKTRNDDKFIKELRVHLLEKGYNFIKFIERNGYCEEAAILDFEQAKIISISE